MWRKLIARGSAIDTARCLSTYRCKRNLSKSPMDARDECHMIGLQSESKIHRLQVVRGLLTECPNPL
jgi:hypothetical protein